VRLQYSQYLVLVDVKTSAAVRVHVELNFLDGDVVVGTKELLTNASVTPKVTHDLSDCCCFNINLSSP
jgi:hypothetical protein